MLSNSSIGLEGGFELVDSQSFSYELRTASALPGFGGWVEVTVHTDAAYNESSESQQKLMGLGRLTHKLARNAAGAPPWSVRTSRPFWTFHPCLGAATHSGQSLSMTLVLPETDPGLSARVREELRALGIPDLHHAS